MVFVCADLVRDKISSLLATEPDRGRFGEFAESGWKPTGTAVKGVGKAGSMKTK